MKTDGQGCAVFTDIKEDIFFIEAEKGAYRSAVKPAEMAWNLTSFDTGGEEPVAEEEGTRAFIYTDRGVYRPGDPVELVCIARNGDSFPENHPVTLRIRNPKNRQVYEKTVASARDGFFHFTFQSAPEDPTGRYTASFLVGSSRFFHPVQIETVVPRRLKVDLTAAPETAGIGEDIAVELKAATLFGSPGAGLFASIGVSVSQKERLFKNFKEFTFSHQGLVFQGYYDNLFDGELDESGTVSVAWTPPGFDSVPSALGSGFACQGHGFGGPAE